MIKKDGHTHTEFCPHGSGDDAEKMILRAIGLGFTEYSITEHTPLPEEFKKQTAGAQEAIDTAAMSLNDVEYYLKKMHQLKKKYESEIKINVGFEVDYLPGCESWTYDFLQEYGKQIDDSILSLHFMQGTGGFRSVDFSPEDYDEGIVQYYGSFQKAQEAYFKMLSDMIELDLGTYQPKRIGHITLCRKFKDYFKKEDTGFSNDSMFLLENILDTVKEKDLELDINTAGLFKPDCNEIYPPLSILNKVQEKGIRCCYGSDSHSTADVGRAYADFNEAMKGNAYAKLGQ